MSSVYSALSLFAGCGGSDLGLQGAGVEVVWANEKSQSACDLYEDVVGRTVEHGDIKQIDRFPDADIIAGCYPCQGYSQAGARRSSDTINFLYREFDRVLRLVKPLAFIVENVDGMRFAQNDSLLRSQLTRFRMAGYSVSWKVLNAKSYGVPQDRRRLFIVGTRSSEKIRFKFPEPQYGTGSGLKPFVTLRKAIWHLRDAEAGSYNDEPFHWYYLSRNRRRTWDEVAQCVVAHWRHLGLHPDSPPLRKVGKDRWELSADGNARRFSYLECAVLQGFPDPAAFRKGTVRARVRAIGNAVPPPLFEAVASSLIAQLKSRER